jgi:hypothetical protein
VCLYPLFSSQVTGGPFVLTLSGFPPAVPSEVNTRPVSGPLGTPLFVPTYVLAGQRLKVA